MLNKRQDLLMALPEPTRSRLPMGIVSTDSAFCLNLIEELESDGGFEIRQYCMNELPDGKSNSDSLPKQSLNNQLDIPDITVIIPTIRSPDNWLCVTQNKLEQEFAEVLNECFRFAKQLAPIYMKNRRGHFVFCTPQLNQQLPRIYESLLKQKQAVFAEGLYALCKVIALEFASKGITSCFVDIPYDAEPRNMIPLVRWLADERSSFSTGMRITMA